jgi:hypothetical protein
MALKKNPIEFRKLLIFDFVGGLLAGVAYFAFFNFLIDELKLPNWLASTQMTANFAYGLFGFFLYVSNTKNNIWLSALILLNFIYGALAIGTSLALFEAGLSLGAILLLVEGIYVFLLSLVERKSLLFQRSIS